MFFPASSSCGFAESPNASACRVHMNHVASPEYGPPARHVPAYFHLLNFLFLTVLSLIFVDDLVFLLRDFVSGALSTLRHGVSRTVRSVPRLLAPKSIASFIRVALHKAFKVATASLSIVGFVTVLLLLSDDRQIVFDVFDGNGVYAPVTTLPAFFENGSSLEYYALSLGNALFWALERLFGYPQALRLVEQRWTQLVLAIYGALFNLCARQVTLLVEFAIAYLEHLQLFVDDLQERVALLLVPETLISAAFSCCCGFLSVTYERSRRTFAFGTIFGAILSSLSRPGVASDVYPSFEIYSIRCNAFRCNIPVVVESGFHTSIEILVIALVVFISFVRTFLSAIRLPLESLCLAWSDYVRSPAHTNHFIKLAEEEIETIEDTNPTTIDNPSTPNHREAEPSNSVFDDDQLKAPIPRRPWSCRSILENDWDTVAVANTPTHRYPTPIVEPIPPSELVLDPPKSFVPRRRWWRISVLNRDGYDTVTDSDAPPSRPCSAKPVVKKPRRKTKSEHTIPPPPVLEYTCLMAKLAEMGYELDRPSSSWSSDDTLKDSDPYDSDDSVAFSDDSHSSSVYAPSDASESDAEENIAPSSEHGCAPVALPSEILAPLPLSKPVEEVELPPVSRSNKKAKKGKKYSKPRAGNLKAGGNAFDFEPYPSNAGYGGRRALKSFGKKFRGVSSEDVEFWDEY